jgi:exopolysaccharide production protein ExoZ
LENISTQRSRTAVIILIIMQIGPEEPHVPHAFRGVQALRGIAAVMVVVMHSTISWDVCVAGGTGRRDWFTGGMGVDIFFVISGFVMALTALPPSGPRYSAGEFFQRRLERIVPAYWVATAAMVPIWLWRHHIHYPIIPAPSVKFVLISLFFIPVRDQHWLQQPMLLVGWTLNFEMAFYLLIALALWMRPNAFRLVAVVLAVAPLLQYWHRPGLPAVALYGSILLWEFLAGMLLARYVGLGKKVPLTVGIPSGIAGVCAVILGHVHHAVPANRLTWAATAFLIVLFAVSIEPRFGRLWPKSMLILGDMSFSIYLIHTQVSNITVPLLMWLRVMRPDRTSVLNEWVSTSLIAATGIAAGVLFYLGVEKPFIEYFRSRRQKRKAATPTPDYLDAVIHSSQAVSARSH